MEVHRTPNVIVYQRRNQHLSPPYVVVQIAPGNRAVNRSAWSLDEARMIASEWESWLKSGASNEW